MGNPFPCARKRVAVLMRKGQRCTHENNDIRFILKYSFIAFIGLGIIFT